MWSHLAPRQPLSGDFTGALELQDAINLVDAAESDFMALPAEVRAVCQNNPVQLLERMTDRDQFHELVEAGLPVETTYEPPQLPEPPPEPEPPAPNPIVGGE